MKPLTDREALDLILANVPPPRIEPLPLLKAVGHALAEDVAADRDFPPWPKSLMDGFAARSVDIAAAPVELDVVAEVHAGRTPERPLGPRQAIRIMTGAPVPEGADCVVNCERTSPIDGGKRVRIVEGVRPGANITPRGLEARAGERLIAAGTRLRAQEIAVLASVGHTEVRVYRHPTCAILVTGDELVEADCEPHGAQIRNSNAYGLCTQAMSARMPFAYLGIAADDREILRQRLRAAFLADVVLTSGGVSAGDRDLVKECLAAEGAEILFDQVKIKPGKPLTFARKGKTRIFALPGNPVATFVGFEVFVRPFVAAFACDPSLRRPVVRARLRAPIKKSGDRTQYLPACAEFGEAGWTVAEAAWHGSGDAVGLARANALAIVPLDSQALEAGAAVETMLLE